MKYHVICDIKKKGEKNDVYVHVTSHRKPYVQIIRHKIKKILTFTLLATENRMFKSLAKKKILTFILFATE